MLPLLSPLLLLLASVAPSHLFACSAGAAPNRSGAAAEAGKLIFILAGQSNMAGRGGVTGDRWNRVVPPECRPSPAILRLNAGLRWEEAREPLHADIDVLKTCGVGPSMAFAHEILPSAAAPAVVGLVPCAIGGTKITQWGRGTPLYGEMVRRARAAGGGGGRMGGVLWYQGESDTVSRADAEAYMGRMEKLIRDLRSDLGLPGLLVIQISWLELGSLAGTQIKGRAKLRSLQSTRDFINIASCSCIRRGKLHRHSKAGSEGNQTS
ncbi:probable carbohydrate esterase At4g34215 isoform X2 [Phoenix dactylifera]|uniref:Probable carbohydrate esterase At4g34215 isoform X2 n=1 Tax=Phoenix dactylifera TaxID=42345 RepID=A0A8B8ZVY0_PHODC|nr:probable carbohydrate esterase At4g34215 isoform X2 [Phoenix dactylifera]